MNRPNLRPRKLKPVNGCELALVNTFDKWRCRVTQPDGKQFYFDYVPQARRHANNYEKETR